MESIGEKLKKTREQKGFSLEQATRDTHISKRYLISMEEEDFDSFPGETYLLGFLRNYAEYLGINPKDIVNLYRNMKLQEQPAPIEALVSPKRRKKKPGIIVLIVCICLAGLSVGGYFAYTYFFDDSTINSLNKRKVEKKEKIQQTHAYTLSAEFIEQEFHPGDSVNVPIDEKQYEIVLASISEQVTFSTEGVQHSLALQEAKQFDLTQDGEVDIMIIVRQIRNNEEAPSAVIRFDRIVQSPTSQPAQNSPEIREEELTQTNAIGSTNEPSRMEQSYALIKSKEPKVFSIHLEFSDYCFFRYKIDEKEREEKFFRNGEVFRASVQRSIRLWISNAGAVKARIAQKSLELGNPGEVVTKLISWVYYEESDEYNLEVIPVY